MKNLIAIMILAFGMLLTMPPGNQAQSANTHQITFVSDVGQIMPAYVQVTYDFVALPLVVYQIGAYDLPVSDVPIVCTVVEQKRPDFNSFYCLNYRTCFYARGKVNSQNKKLMQDIALVHRFARDGLTQV